MADITAERSAVWLPVVGYEQFYEVSNLGEVRRALNSAPVPGTQPGRTLQATLTAGYLVVSLSADGVSQTQRVHRIVLEAFCGPEPFPGAHAAHNNGITSDCSLRNLRWATPTENQADVDRHGRRCRGVEVYGAILDDGRVRDIRRRCARGETNRAIAADNGVSVSTIHLIRHNRIWRHVA